MEVLVLVVYAAAVIWLGRRAAAWRRSGAEDYILASRTLTLPGFVATLVPSFYGGALGVGEYSYRYGISNWVTQGVPYYIFALLYAAFLAGRIRVQPGLTLPDHLEKAYGRAPAVLAALLIFLLASPADEILMLATLGRWVTGWPLAACSLLAAALGVGFLFSGGLRADAWTNRLEFLVMFGGFSLILPFAYLAVGGLPTAAGNLPPAHLDLTGGQGSLHVLTWFFIALWTFVDPTFHQRVCAAKDPRTARLGIATSVLFWFCFDAMTTTTGLYARALLPNLADPLQAYPALARELLPPVVRGLFLAGVASSTLASLSSTSFVAAISLSRDVLGRLLAIEESRQERWIQAGLAATSAMGVALALALPSVVGLWYTVGSTVIPALLLPVLSIYFERLRVPPAVALAGMLGGWLGAGGAWLLGSGTPFYPGLALSIAIWLVPSLRTHATKCSN